MFLAVSCNQSRIGTDLFETARDDAKCFDTALLLQDSAQMGKLSGVTYAKGICHNGSVALDGEKSFFTPAVIVNQVDLRAMYASFVFRDQSSLYIQNEQDQRIKIGELDTSFGQAAIKLSSDIKIQVALEQDELGKLVPVLILEMHESSRI